MQTTLQSSSCWIIFYQHNGHLDWPEVVEANDHVVEQQLQPTRLVAERRSTVFVLLLRIRRWTQGNLRICLLLMRRMGLLRTKLTSGRDAEWRRNYWVGRMRRRSAASVWRCWWGPLVEEPRHRKVATTTVLRCHCGVRRLDRHLWLYFQLEHCWLRDLMGYWHSVEGRTYSLSPNLLQLIIILCELSLALFPLLTTINTININII